jgi:hypothetical protein
MWLLLLLCQSIKGTPLFPFNKGIVSVRHLYEILLETFKNQPALEYNLVFVCMID